MVTLYEAFMRITFRCTGSSVSCLVSFLSLKHTFLILAGNSVVEVLVIDHSYKSDSGSLEERGRRYIAHRRTSKPFWFNDNVLIVDKLSDC